MFALGSDHGGFDLKERVKAYLDREGIPYQDYGCHSKESCDYPVFGKAAAEAVASGVCEKGIVICTTGIGISIAANKVRGIRCALAGAAGKDRTEAAAALSKARQELTALLAASGRPADALEPKFTCKLCQDTGSVQGRTCTCVHKLMQGLRREEIEALSSLSISSFDTMELRYYPNTMDEKLGEPVRTYMGGLLEDLRSYAEEFDHNSESLMLFGNAGLGKTHAALAIAGIVLQKDFDVIYVSSPDFFGKLENARFDSSEDAETLLRTASAADLLILDDLGTEFVTPYFITTFYSLLNNRLGAGLPTIVTTNIADGSLLEKRYTEKISSRLSSFVPCLFAGEDIRGLKAAE